MSFMLVLVVAVSLLCARCHGVNRTMSIKMWETQVLSTHDSSHVHAKRWFPLVFNGYPQGLSAQLDGGVRSLEIDMTPAVDLQGLNPQQWSFRSDNLPGIDADASCHPVEACFAEIVSWCLRNPDHFPLTIFIDPDLHEQLPVFSTPAEWQHLGQYLLHAFERIRGRVFTMQDFHGLELANEEKIGGLPIDALRGKVILVMDHGENNAAPLVRSGFMDPAQLPFWLSCRRRDIQDIETSDPKANPHWCHYVKIWGDLPRPRQAMLLAKHRHFMMRTPVDYRLMQTRTLQKIRSVTDPVVMQGKTVAPTAIDWVATYLFNALDGNQDGYVNFLDRPLRELINGFRLQNSPLIFLLRHVGVPRFLAVQLWEALTSLSSIGEELGEGAVRRWLITGRDQAISRRDIVMRANCVQLLTTDFPGALFGDLEFSLAAPSNGEFFLSSCAGDAANAAMPDVRVFPIKNSTLSSAEWQAYEQLPELPGVSFTGYCWLCYGVLCLAAVLVGIPVLLVRCFTVRHPDESTNTRKCFASLYASTASARRRRIGVLLLIVCLLLCLELQSISVLSD